MEIAPDVYLARQQEWQFFATLTWRKVPSWSVQQKALFAWLRWVEGLPGVASRSLLFMVREELGEVGGRSHMHALLAGLPNRLVNTRTAMASCAQWERLGGGMARNYIYSNHLDGVEYVFKGLSDTSHGKGALKYEIGKFCGEEGRRILLGHAFSAKLLFRKANKRLVTARAMRALGRGS